MSTLNQNRTAQSVREKSGYRWVMLTLSTLTSLLVIAMPMMSLPVLFKEIAVELNLSLVQIGLIWGISSFTGLFVGLIGGVMGDRFGTRRVLVGACLFIGIFGASRGLAVDFVSFHCNEFLCWVYLCP